MQRTYHRAPAATARMRELWATVEDPTCTDLERLAAAEILGKHLDEWQRGMVRALRSRGVPATWDTIAEALGLTRSSALYRYRDVESA